jgi:Starch synthase catalytic domain
MPGRPKKRSHSTHQSGTSPSSSRLGDVVAGLSKSLRRMGHDTRIVLPLYASIDRARYGLVGDGTACVHMGSCGAQWIGLQRVLALVSVHPVDVAAQGKNLAYVEPYRGHWKCVCRP